MDELKAKVNFIMQIMIIMKANSKMIELMDMGNIPTKMGRNI